MTWTVRHGRLAELRRRIGGIGSQHDRLDWLIAGELLSRGHRFPRRAMQLAALLLGDDEDHSNHPRFVLSSFWTEPSFAASARRPGDQLRLLGLARNVEAGHAGARRWKRCGRDLANLLLLRRHDALQRGVAQLIDAALNSEQCRQRHLHPLEPAPLQLALHAHVRLLYLHVHDDRGVRQPKALGEDHAGLRGALIVGLKAGQHKVEFLLAHGVGERAGDDKGICGDRREAIVLNVNGAIGAARQRFAQHLRRARRPGSADDDLAAMLLSQAKRLFERVGVGLVHLEAGILLAHAAPAFRRCAAATRGWEPV